MKPEESETLRRFDLWFATKLHTNNHIPFLKAVLGTENKDFMRGWNMAMVMVSNWLTDVANGHYDTEKYDLKFDNLENLERKWNLVLSKLGKKEEQKPAHREGGYSARPTLDLLEKKKKKRVNNDEDDSGDIRSGFGFD